MNHARPMGVQAPQNTISTEQAPTMTVTQLTELKPILVEYGDERGNKHTTVAFIAGDKAYLPPNGEQWTAGFRSFTKAINDQILDRYEALQARKGLGGGPIPTSDAVDITGGGEAISAATGIEHATAAPPAEQVDVKVG